eukprot:TRINITY_DN1230_c0_g2_i1.p1 TRINITY_DN1230_c0_g2~~TRINITY_DN1230_c0_g2_i1.p1  ORF type:complete len:455 (+),score=54.51 TRINITY_DN1230_c0_g2_i1:206-1570(+)
MESNIKKRKVEENGEGGGDGVVAETAVISREDARKIIEPFSKDELLDILSEAATKHLDVLDAIRAIADKDPAQRKLFIRGLGWDTTTESLKALFSQYGEIEEGVVIMDKHTGKSKGYGFITFKHLDGALNALKEPSKKIDGRMTVCQLASTGSQGNQQSAADSSARKIFVGNVPIDMPSDRLLGYFSQFGEIEEGPLGYDKQTGKSRGYALFIYKTVDGLRRALEEPVKSIGGHQIVCKLAGEGQKPKPPTGPLPTDGSEPGALHSNPMNPLGPLPTNLGMPYGHGSYMNPGPALGMGMNQGSGLGGVPTAAGAAHHHGVGSAHSTATGMPALSHPLNPSAISAHGGSQAPSSMGYSGHGSYGGGPHSGGYGAASHGSGGGTGYGGSVYGTPTSGGPVASHSGGGYPDSGHYSSLSASYQSQSHSQSQHQQPGQSPAARVPGGMYPGMPPYYNG